MELILFKSGNNVGGFLIIFINILISFIICTLCKTQIYILNTFSYICQSIKLLLYLFLSTCKRLEFDPIVKK